MKESDTTMTDEEKEFFVVANSFAAPVCSDTSTTYIKGKSPEDAMNRFVQEYKHPAGLYAANLYTNADAYHKNEEPLAKYRHPKVKENKRKNEEYKESLKRS